MVFRAYFLARSSRISPATSLATPRPVLPASAEQTAAPTPTPWAAYTAFHLRPFAQAPFVVPFLPLESEFQGRPGGSVV